MAIFSGVIFLITFDFEHPTKSLFSKAWNVWRSVYIKPAISTRCCCTLYLDTKFQYLKHKEHSWRTGGVISKCNYSILFWSSLINLPDCKANFSEVIFKFKIGPLSNVTSYYLTACGEVGLVYISYFIKQPTPCLKLLKDMRNRKMSSWQEYSA